MDQYRAVHPDAYGLPVPPRGSARARLLIIGLAPGRRGANHTGRVFDGDFSSRFLFASLARCGLVDSADPTTARLTQCRLTNVVKCWPPDNRPTAEELHNCRRWLEPELADFWKAEMRKPRVILALGRAAHEQLQRVLPDLWGAKGNSREETKQSVSLGSFSHGARQQLKPRLCLFSSYHPSLQNVNTGRLNAQMLDGVLHEVLRALDR